MNNKSLIEQFTDQPNWYLVKVTIQPNDVIKHSITPSKIFRKVSNSKQCFNPYLGNNREFWKNYMIGGYYYSNCSNEGVMTIYFFLRSNQSISDKMVRINVVVRLKKIVPCSVEFGGLELLPKYLFDYLNINYGLKYMVQPFGDYYSNKVPFIN